MRWTRSLVVGAAAVAIGASTLPFGGAARGATAELPTGLDDPTFGVNGVVAPPLPATSWSAGAVAADGSVALATGTQVGHFSAAGVADAGFAGDGIVDLVADLGLSLGGHVRVRDLAPIPGGALVVLADSDTGLYLVGLTSTGSLDTGFAATAPTPGVVEVSASGGAWYDRVVRQSSGRLVVIHAPAGVDLTAFTAAGSLDTGFGSGGFVSVAPTELIAPTAVFASGRFPAEVDGSDRIVLGGTTLSLSGALVRLTPDGAPDPGFGTGGRATRLVTPGDRYAEVASLVVDDAGRITAGLSGGNRPDDTYTESASLWRVDATGNDDVAFGSAGVTVLSPAPLATVGVGVFSLAKTLGGATLVEVITQTVPVIAPHDPSYLTRVDTNGVADTWKRPATLGVGGLVGMPDGGALRPGVANRVLPGRVGPTPDFVDIAVSWDNLPGVRRDFGWFTSGDVVAQRSGGRIVGLVGSGTFDGSGLFMAPATYTVTFNARGFWILPVFLGSVQINGGTMTSTMPLFFTGFQATARVVHTAPQWFYLYTNPFQFGSWRMDITFYDGNS